MMVLLQGKKLIFTEPTTILYTSLFLSQKQWTCQMRKRQRIQNGKNSRKYRHGSWRKSETKKKGDRWSKERSKNIPLCVINGHLSSQFGVGTNITKKKKQRPSGTPKWHCWKMIQDHTQYSLNKDHQLHKMTAAKVMDVIARLPGCAGQAKDAASAYTQVKMEDAPSFSENSKVRLSRYLDTSTKARNGPYHGPVWKILVILWKDYYGKGNLRKFC